MFAQILKVTIVFMVFYTQTNGHITIDMEPEELQSIGEVLVQSYFTHNLIQRERTTRNLILSQTMKFLSSAFQLSALTISLVSANLLTAMFQQLMQQTHQNFNTTNNMLKPSEMCPYDFGCDDYMCWRACDNGKKADNAKSWCYTTTKPEKHQYQHCAGSYECSPCWDCLGPCNW